MFPLMSLTCQAGLLRGVERQQDAMQRLLEEERREHKKAEEAEQLAVKKKSEQKEQPKAEVEAQDQKEAPKEKKSQKLFPKSALFREWGENLSEDDQREAQGLFEKYGYNVFLSERLPLDRTLPDTRDPR